MQDWGSPNVKSIPGQDLNIRGYIPEFVWMVVSLYTL